MSIIAAVFAAATVALTPVSPVLPVSSVRVITRDLDLATSGGRRALGLRVARAAGQLCDTPDARFDVRIRVAQRQCRETAIATALASAPATGQAAMRSTR